MIELRLTNDEVNDVIESGDTAKIVAAIERLKSVLASQSATIESALEREQQARRDLDSAQLEYQRNSIERSHVEHEIARLASAVSGVRLTVLNNSGRRA